MRDKVFQAEVRRQKDMTRYICLAVHDCDSACGAWGRDDWGAMLQWIDSAQSNLKAARQKVEEHIAEEKE